MALVVALALMTGLQGELQDRILGSSAHIFVYKTRGIDDYHAEVTKIRAVAGVTGAAPAVMGKAMITGIKIPAFLQVKGIDPELEPSVNEVATSLTDGSLTELTPATEDDLPGIVIGKDLAGADRSDGRRHGDGADAGGHADADGCDASPAALQGGRHVSRRSLRHRLVEWLRRARAGYADRRHRRVDHIEVKLSNAYDAPRIADQMAVEFGPDYLTQDWTDINQELYSALMLEKIGMGIGIGLIVMVAALNIIASLILLVMEKTRDIAILKTMGASKKSIMLVFLLQGTIIGVIGTVVGAISGGRARDHSRSLSPDHDPERRLPGELPAIPGAARRRGHGDHRRGRGVLPGHALSVAPGGAARSRTSAPL